MTMAMTLLKLLVGLLVLTGGAEMLVRGASRLAMRFGVSPMIVGMTVVAIGTSTPELAVSVSAAFTGSTDIAMGNVVGSNICNIGLVLGLSALIWPLGVGRETRAFLFIMLASSFLVPIMSLDTQIGRVDGLILLAGMGLMTWWLVANRDRHLVEPPPDLVAETPEDDSDLTFWQQVNKSLDLLPVQIIFIVSGIALLVMGSDLIVDAARIIAMALGVSERVIGLTLVAFNTSLPELATSLVAVIRKDTAIGVGNLIGSNITNVLLVLGATSVVTAVPAGLTVARIVDLAMMLGVEIGLIVAVLRRERVGRAAGAAFVGAYLGYTIYLFVGAA
ncbi:calcium/sodium antiporter [bacterium]|nr:calcium/sodium antiporter [bacterium]